MIARKHSFSMDCNIMLNLYDGSFFSDGIFNTSTTRISCRLTGIAKRRGCRLVGRLFDRAGHFPMFGVCLFVCLRKWAF